MCPEDNCNKQYQIRSRLTKYIEKFHQKSSISLNDKNNEVDKNDKSENPFNYKASKEVIDDLIAEAENAELLNDVEIIENLEDDTVSAIVEETPDISDIPDEIFICDMCRVSFTNKNEWEQHEESEHEEEIQDKNDDNLKEPTIDKRKDHMLSNDQISTLLKKLHKTVNEKKQNQ